MKTRERIEQTQTARLASLASSEGEKQTVADTQAPIKDAAASKPLSLCTALCQQGLSSMIKHCNLAGMKQQ